MGIKTNIPYYSINDLNYFERGYLFGWSNSGYYEDTTFYIDNVEFSDTPPTVLYDLNSDGKVDITDVQACVNHFLGAQDWGTKADVNGDGSINVQDVQSIVNAIL